MDTTSRTTTHTITVEQVGQREFALVMNGGTVRCYVTGTREQAEAEAARILRGIAADAAWMAR